MTAQEGYLIFGALFVLIMGTFGLIAAEIERRQAKKDQLK